MQLLGKFLDQVLNPAVKLLFGAAVVYFIWGVFMYVRKGDSDVAKTEGKNHVLWSTIGLFIMTSVWGIMHFLQNSITVLK